MCQPYPGGEYKSVPDMVPALILSRRGGDTGTSQQTPRTQRAAQHTAAVLARGTRALRPTLAGKDPETRQQGEQQELAWHRAGEEALGRGREVRALGRGLGGTGEVGRPGRGPKSQAKGSDFSQG